MAVQRLSTGLSSLVVGVILMVALFATGSHGQSASLLANSVPLSNDVYEAYFGDGQSTTPIGNRLPECVGGTSGVANLSLKLENIVTNQVIQQMAITGRTGGIIWNPTLFPTVLSTLSGRYVCTIFSSSFMATHTDTYQLNVVVPMNINCAFPANLSTFSMNVLACNVTGYPQPIVSWSGINRTIPVTQTTMSNGTARITSSVSFEGLDIVSDVGDSVTIDFTARYPPFNCTSLQNPPSPMGVSVCEAIPKSVNYSRTLVVGVGCPAFNNTSWNPPNSSIAYYPTEINISCAAGYTGSSPMIVRCQVDGSWTTFPMTCEVAMGITCQYPANIKYESLNVLSCNVTGYPLPMVSWTGINGTTPTPTLSGGINGTTTNAPSGGIYKITATNSIWGDQTESEPGSFVTVNVTAQYPAFNCTSLQNPTALRNPCESIPKVVTYTSKLLVVAACVPFTDTAFIPSTPPSTEYGTNFSIDCAPGYESRPNTPTIDRMSCQANGSWTPFPTCIDLDRCLSSPCNHASATCVNTISSFFCQCPVSSVGVTNDACKSTVCAALCHDSNSVCQDNGGTLSCGCRVGYNGSGLSINSCNNANECLSSPCQDSLATCLDTEGSFLCLCPAELLGNGLKRGGCSRAVESPGTNSLGLTAGVGCGAFFLGSIIASLITWFLAKRKYKYGTDQTGNCDDPQVGKPPDVVTMTNSDAYGMVDIPTTQQQQPQYEYVLP